MKKKIVKATPAEKVKVDKALRKQYPQMYTEKWVKMLKKGVKKEFTTARTKTIEAKLRKSGMSEKEIAKLRGKK